MPLEEADHRDAWNVAHFRADLSKSNLALAYIELRHLARHMWQGPITDEEQDRLKAILNANEV